VATSEKLEGVVGPQITWANIVSIGILASVVVGGGYAILQAQFGFVDKLASTQATELVKQIELERSEIALVRSEYLSLREHAAYQHEQEIINTAFRLRLTALETEQRDLIAHSARNPIEAREMDQLSASFDKQISSLRSQIDDINRQIAASILHPAPIPNSH
jgi:hypothetical protein